VITGLFSDNLLGFLVRPVNTETGGVLLITPPLDVVFNNFLDEVDANVDDTRLPLLPFVVVGFKLAFTFLVGVTVVAFFVAGISTLVAVVVVVVVADVGRVYYYN
jgi:hypothetical protein